jgi:hypothetical protein
LENLDDNGSYVCCVYDVNGDGGATDAAGITAGNWFRSKEMMKNARFKKREKRAFFSKDAISCCRIMN